MAALMSWPPCIPPKPEAVRCNERVLLERCNDATASKCCQLAPWQDTSQLAVLRG